MLITPIHFNKIKIKYGFTPEGYYEELLKPKYNQEPYTKRTLEENMMVVNVHTISGWNPLYIMDHTTKRAYVFMDEHYKLQTVTHDDIDWESLQGESNHVIERARNLNVYLPSSIGSYCDGVAMVSWKLSRDGRYYDNGSGCLGDVEVAVYGFIDKQCRVVIPFRLVKNYNELLQMQAQAVEIIKQRNRG